MTIGDLFLNQGGGCFAHVFAPDAGRRAGKVYFAFRPDAHTADHAAATANRLCSRHGLMGGVSPGVLHASICPIGEFPELSETRIEAAIRTASRVVARPFEMVLDRVRTYPPGPANGQKKRPLVLFAGNGAVGAALLRRSLIRDLRRSGFLPHRNQPDFHMTLLYDRCVVAEEPIAPIRWMVRDFALVHSIHGEGRHVILGQWPLAG